MILYPLDNDAKQVEDSNREDTNVRSKGNTVFNM